MAVISNIQRNYGNMFSAEKRAADFILQYSEELIEQNYTCLLYTSMMVPGMVEIPPANEVPPMTQAAMASVS